MKKVELRMNEEEKYKVIKELVDHNGNKNNAELRLNLSRRQINRLIKIYKEKGKPGFIHGNRSRKPFKTLDKTLSNDIITLYTTKYQDFNFTHFHEYLKDVENITVSYHFVYKTLMNTNIVSPRIRKSTKKKLAKERLIRENKLNNKTEKEIDTILTNEIALEDAHPRLPKPKYFGEVTEMDGSIHNWFGEHKSCLHLAIDKATGHIVGGYFDTQETLKGYYNIFNQILTTYAIPSKFHTDNRTVFNYSLINPDKRTSDKDVLTQFGYACKQLGVDLKTSSVAQFKGLIERHNGTFQGRLVNELKLNNITTIDEANIYLLNTFIPKFNHRFALDITKFESTYETIPSTEKINYTLAVLTPRKIDSGCSIKFYNEYYQPFKDNKIKCFSKGTECLVIKAFDGSLVVSINDEICEFRKLLRNETHSKDFDLVPDNNQPQNKEIYTPPMRHPWKAASFKKQIQKSHKKNIYA